MRYTIINFTRLGDLLQTQSTIAALKKSIHNIHINTKTSQIDTACASSSHHQHQISLICLEQFVDAAHFIDELDNITLFTSSKLLKTLHKDWRLAMQELEIWVDNYYKKFPYDVIINLTPSMNCRVFAHLLSRKAPHIKLEGFALDSFGYGQNSSVWTTYIQAVTKERGCSPYNLIDGFRSMLNLAPEPFHLKKPNKKLQENAYAFLIQEKEDFLKTNQVKRKANAEISFIAFQLGASNEARQWDIENFAQLGSMLWEKNYIPVLLGSAQDKHLASAYIKASKKINPQQAIINLCGKTNLEELGALLTQVKALVSNDTGTLHLAVGLGTPVVGIYLATAQVFDTGPYGLGHLCLEPRLECHPCSFSHVCEFENRCRKTISSQSVFNALTFLMSSQTTEHHKRQDHNPSIHDSKTLHLEDARVWQSYFDESAFVNYHSLSGDENSDRTQWMACQRLFYRHFLHCFSLSQNIQEACPTLKINNYQNSQTNTAYSHNAQTFENFSKISYENSSLPLKNITIIQENIPYIERLLSLILLLKEQANILNMRPSVKLQENFFASIERINTYLSQNSSFTALYLLWKNLIQEHSQSIETLIHFFDTLHKELLLFLRYLQKSSSA